LRQWLCVAVPDIGLNLPHAIDLLPDHEVLSCNFLGEKALGEDHGPPDLPRGIVPEGDNINY
jgi:hypothetical protein